MSEVTCLSEIFAAQLQVLCILCPLLRNVSTPVPVQMDNYWLDLKKKSTRHIQTASAYVKSHKSTP